MRRGNSNMNRGQGPSFGGGSDRSSAMHGGPLLTNHLRDLDMELQLLKRKREIFQQEQDMFNRFSNTSNFAPDYNNQHLSNDYSNNINKRQYDNRQPFYTYNQQGSSEQFSSAGYSNVYESGPAPFNIRSQAVKRPPIWENQNPTPPKRFPAPYGINPWQNQGAMQEYRGKVQNPLPKKLSAQSRSFNNSKPSIGQRINNRYNPPAERKNLKPSKVNKPKPVSKAPTFCPSEQTKKLIEENNKLEHTNNLVTPLSKPKNSKPKSQNPPPKKQNTPIKAKSPLKTPVTQPVFHPNKQLVGQMKGRTELALGMILKSVKSLCTGSILDYFLLPFIQRSIKHIIRVRIKNMVENQEIISVTEILDRYREVFPKETDVELMKIAQEADEFNRTHGDRFQLIEADNPEVFFKRNMGKMLHYKLEELFKEIQKVYEGKVYDIEEYVKIFADKSKTIEEKDKDADKGTNAEQDLKAEKDTNTESNTDAEKDINAENNTDAEKDITAENNTDAEKVINAENNTDAEKDITAENNTDAEKVINAENNTDAEKGTDGENDTDAEKDTDAAKYKDAENYTDAKKDTDDEKDKDAKKDTNVEKDIKVENDINEEKEKKKSITQGGSDIKAITDDLSIKTKHYVEFMDKLIEQKLPSVLPRFTESLMTIFCSSREFFSVKALIVSEMRAKMQKTMEEDNSLLDFNIKTSASKKFASFPIPKETAGKPATPKPTTKPAATTPSTKLAATSPPAAPSTTASETKATSAKPITTAATPSTTAATPSTTAATPSTTAVDTVTPVKTTTAIAPVETTPVKPSPAAAKPETSATAQSSTIVTPVKEAVKNGPSTPKTPASKDLQYIKLIGRPALPARAVIYEFLNKFKPASIKKHKSINNLLVIGFTEKEGFENILAANESVVGDSTVIIKASEQISTPGLNKTVEHVNKTHDSKPTEQNIKTEAQNEGNKTLDQNEENKTPTNGNKPLNDSEQLNLTGEIINEFDSQISELLSSIRKADEEEKKTEVEKMDSELDNEIADLTKKPDENKEQQTLNAEESSAPKISTTMKNLDTVMEVDDETKKAKPIEEIVKATKESGRATPTRSSSRLANVTPSTIKTRRASRLANN